MAQRLRRQIKSKDRQTVLERRGQRQIGKIDEMPESWGHGGDSFHSDTAPANEKPLHANCWLSVWKCSLKLICIISRIKLPFISRENFTAKAVVELLLSHLTLMNSGCFLIINSLQNCIFLVQPSVPCVCTMSRCAPISVKACTLSCGLGL